MGVVQGLLDGCSNKEIAEHLHLSVATVKFHLHSIYQKIGTTSRAKAWRMLSVRHQASQ
jgi:DNA-binding NarL/FixJ family response regulator